MGERVDVVAGQRLRRRRRLLAMTQREVAEACGLSFQQIQKYESAASRISLATLWKLACALEVDVGYFFEGLAPDTHAEERRRPRAAEPDRSTAVRRAGGVPRREAC